jgi:uncharacterized protein (TIGR00369 family)
MDSAVTDMLEMGRQVLASQPFSRLIGAELAEFAEGKAVLVIPVVESLKQQFGYLHGGVLSYAADNAITFAGGSVLGTAVLTAEYKINYLVPAVGEQIIALASVIYAGKRQAVCRCEVFSVRAGQETLCAVAQGTIVKIGGPETT